MLDRWLEPDSEIQYDSNCPVCITGEVSRHRCTGWWCDQCEDYIEYPIYYSIKRSFQEIY